MRGPEHRFQTIFLLAAALLSFSAFRGAAAHGPTEAPLTPETYRERCLLCHKVPPDGIAPEIVAGLAVRPGPRARDLMPNTICWRRCEKCWPKTPPASPKQTDIQHRR